MIRFIRSRRTISNLLKEQKVVSDIKLFSRNSHETLKILNKIPNKFFYTQDKKNLYISCLNELQNQLEIFDQKYPRKIEFIKIQGLINLCKLIIAF